MDKYKLLTLNSINRCEKNNGTGRPADMAEDPQTIETHDINLQHIAMVRAK